MKKTIVALFTVLCFGFTFQSGNNSSKEPKSGQAEENVQYQCPMDCEKGKTYESEGRCPVCGMDMEKAPVRS